MYFVLKSLKFIYIIPLYMFRTQLCPSSGAYQLHVQSLVSINYKNTCCLQICRYVHFIITTNYLCDTYKHSRTGGQNEPSTTRHVTTT